MKLLETPDAGLILAPVWVIVGASAVTFVPYGTVTAIVCAASVIVPVAEGETKLKAVIALSLADVEAMITVTV